LFETRQFHLSIAKSRLFADTRRIHMTACIGNA